MWNGITLMKTLKTLATILDRFIWMIGLMTIFIYTDDHWPAIYFIAACVFLGTFAVWYFWKFFLLPFKDGLRGS
jgi:hypothetical protein